MFRLLRCLRTEPGPSHVELTKAGAEALARVQPLSAWLQTLLSLMWTLARHGTPAPTQDTLDGPELAQRARAVAEGEAVRQAVMLMCGLLRGCASTAGSEALQLLFSLPWQSVLRESLLQCGNEGIRGAAVLVARLLSEDEVLLQVAAKHQQERAAAQNGHAGATQPALLADLPQGIAHVTPSLYFLSTLLSLLHEVPPGLQAADEYFRLCVDLLHKVPQHAPQLPREFWQKLFDSLAALLQQHPMLEVRVRVCMRVWFFICFCFHFDRFCSDL